MSQLICYNPTALFISVSVDPAIGIIKDLLEKDNTLKDMNSVTSQRHNSLTGILPQKHILFFPGSIL